ncbi:hypothetical protein ACNSOS_04470 [Aliarcobacter vitoriensis]|uniref:hypothetical protein n=1 Tax=Aliarcobacter vitoriensis TaxID=2011099 RepID=UPI003AAD4F86
MSYVGDDKVLPTDNIKNKDNSLFIWLDILGFAEAVDKEEKYKELSELLKEFKQLFFDSTQNSYDAKIISDGLIIYLKDPGRDKINLIFKEISEKQFSFILKNKYFIRGGIALGSKYETDENIEKGNQYISNGLARAYKLESNCIDWPLIATDEINLKRLKDKFKINKEEFFGLEKAYNKNGKNIYFIDFIKEDDNYFELLQNKIFEFKEEPSVRNKYIWLMRYYLHKFENYKDKIDITLKGIVL